MRALRRWARLGLVKSLTAHTRSSRAKSRDYAERQRGSGGAGSRSARTSPSTSSGGTGDGGLIASPAAHVLVLVHRLAEERTQRAADQCAGDAVAAAVDHVAQHRAADAADDQARRPVAPLAIVAPVGAAIDLV